MSTWCDLKLTRQYDWIWYTRIPECAGQCCIRVFSRITHRTRNRIPLFIDRVHQATLSSYLLFNTNTMASSSSSANPTRDEQLLAVGRQCSHPSCGLVDFLPFKCQHCADSFCADHFKPASHSCPKYDEAKFNRVVPDCEHCFCTDSN